MMMMMMVMIMMIIMMRMRMRRRRLRLLSSSSPSPSPSLSPSPVLFVDVFWSFVCVFGQSNESDLAGSFQRAGSGQNKDCRARGRMTRRKSWKIVGSPSTLAITMLEIWSCIVFFLQSCFTVLDEQICDDFTQYRNSGTVHSCPDFWLITGIWYIENT